MNEWQQQEQEYHLRLGTDDSAPAVHHHDTERTWTVEAYDRRLIAGLREAGAPELPSHTDGALFKVDAKQLIQFMADASDLIIEFRTRRKRQYSDEAKAAMAARLAEYRAK